jgi:hypothetical protein
MQLVVGTDLSPRLNEPHIGMVNNFNFFFISSLSKNLSQLLKIIISSCNGQQTILSVKTSQVQD